MKNQESAHSTPRIAAWLAPTLATSMAKGLADRGIELVGLAGDGPELASLADALSVAFHTDPRSLLSSDVEAVLIADPTLGMDSSVIESLMSEATKTQTKLLTLTPRPATFAEATQLRRGSALPRPIGLLGDLVMGRALFESIRSYGTPDSVQLAFDSMMHFGSSSSRLFDAFDVLYELYGSPTSITASVGAAGRVDGLALYTDGRAATFSAGSDAGTCSRSLTAWVGSGRFRWIDGVLGFSDGQREEAEIAEAKERSPSEQAASELAESVGWIVGQEFCSEREERRINVLAAVETCMLAARTGERESVEHLRGAMDRV